MGKQKLNLFSSATERSSFVSYKANLILTGKKLAPFVTL